MTVKELKEVLSVVPDELEIIIKNNSESIFSKLQIDDIYVQESFFDSYKRTLYLNTEQYDGHQNISNLK